MGRFMKRDQPVQRGHVAERDSRDDSAIHGHAAHICDRELVVFAGFIGPVNDPVGDGHAPEQRRHAEGGKERDDKHRDVAIENVYPAAGEVDTDGPLNVCCSSDQLIRISL